MLLLAGGIAGGILAYNAAIAPPSRWKEAPERINRVEGLSLEFSALTFDTEQQIAVADMTLSNDRDEPFGVLFTYWDIDFLYHGKWYTIYDAEKDFKGTLTLAGLEYPPRTEDTVSFFFPDDIIKKRGQYRICYGDYVYCDAEIGFDL